MKIIRAHSNHLGSPSNFLNQFAIFNQHKSEHDAKHILLPEGLRNSDHVIFVAIENKKIVGFTQLYIGFSSVSMQKIWISSNLYVEKNNCKKEVVAKLLMKYAEQYAIKNGTNQVFFSYIKIQNISTS